MNKFIASLVVVLLMCAVRGEVEELFGIKFGSADYQFSRTNLNDRLGLSIPNSGVNARGARKVRLPKPELGFLYGTIGYTDSGTVYRVESKMVVRTIDGEHRASEDEICSIVTNIVSEYSKRYDIQFSKQSDLSYQFYQEHQSFMFTIAAEMSSVFVRGRHPVICIQAYYCNRFPRQKLVHKSRLGRTIEEQNDYEKNLVISNEFGFSFGEVCKSSAGQTVTQRLSRVYCPFTSIQLSYNPTGCLYKIAATVGRGEYAASHGISIDVAGEILHREIVRVVREIEDRYNIDCLAPKIGDELTEENDYKITDDWPRKRYCDGSLGPVCRNARMRVGIQEDKSQISITLTDNLLSKIAPSTRAIH